MAYQRPPNGMTYYQMMQQGLYDPRSESAYGTPEQEGGDGSGQAWGQVAGLAGGVAARYGGQKAGEYLYNQWKGTPTTSTPSMQSSPGQQANFNAGADFATANAGSIYPVQSTNNGTLMSDGSTVKADGSVTVKDGTTVTPDGKVTDSNGQQLSEGSSLGYLQMAAGLWSAYQTSQDGNLSDGQKAARYGQAAMQVYNGYSTVTGGAGLGAWGVGISAGLGIADTYMNDDMTAEQQATRAQQQAALAVADYYTLGLATPVEGWLRGTGTGGKWLGKLDKLDQKTNPLTIGLAAIGSSKSGSQMGRDKVREALQDRKIVGDDWNLKFSDGSAWDIGKDGRAKYQGSDGRDLKYYDVDYGNNLAHTSVGWANPITMALMGEGSDRQREFAGYFANAISQDAPDAESARKRGVELAQKFGYDANSLSNALTKLKDEKKIKEDEYAAYQNGINTLFNPGTTQQQNQRIAQTNQALGTPDFYKKKDPNQPIANALQGKR